MSLSGYADLPLHSGHVPQWLANLMKSLARGILKVLIIEFGYEGLLKRLSNPLWFQAFNNAIGMDWDSSGSTTVTTAIIKEVLNELNLGVRIAGGKGKAALETPDEVLRYCEELGMSTSVANELIKYSKLSAKVDTVLLQDGFTLYHHVIAFNERGMWVVIQQGMNTDLKLARRYHIAWYSSSVIHEEPHSGISSDYRGVVLNLLDRESRGCKNVILDLVRDEPKKVFNMITYVNRVLKGIKGLDEYSLSSRNILNFSGISKSDIRNIPYYRPVKLTQELLLKLKSIYEVSPSTIEELLLVPNVGSEVFRALSLISELIYREPPSLNDPVTHPYDPFKYSFVVGGKDGIPFPIKRELMISVIKELEDVIKDSELGSKEKLIVFRNLSMYTPKELTS